MIKKALLAATVASGLIIPAQAGELYLPPKPSIIKPENIEFSKHLLAMPLTMGMLPRKNALVPLAITNTFNSNSTTNSSTYTYSGASIGTASADRYIIVGTAGREGGNRTFNTCTVGGAATTRLVHQATLNHLALFITNAPVTSGTTADIVITLSGGSQRNAVSVWALTGSLSSITPLDTLSIDSTDPSGSLNVGADGAHVAIAYTNGNTSVTWTGVTEDYDVSFESGNNNTFSSGSDITAAAAARTITANFGSSNDDRMLAASFSRAI
jgi:hypothetical protein